MENPALSELRRLTLGLEMTHHRLEVFERQYGLDSDEFERRFSAGELAENLDFIEWAGEIKTFHLLKGQQKALQEAQPNEVDTARPRRPSLFGSVAAEDITPEMIDEARNDLFRSI